MGNKQFLYIAIATLITVLIWVGMDIYRSQKQPQISPDVSKIMESISPDFDQEALDEIRN